jgi:hypothetical protein
VLISLQRIEHRLAFLTQGPQCVCAQWLDPQDVCVCVCVCVYGGVNINCESPPVFPKPGLCGIPGPVLKPGLEI